VDIPAGTAGAVLNLKFDAAGASYGYLEACMRYYADGAAEPQFLSSGAEDYFLSACKCSSSLCIFLWVEKFKKTRRQTTSMRVSSRRRTRA